MGIRIFNFKNHHLYIVLGPPSLAKTRQNVTKMSRLNIVRVVIHLLFFCNKILNKVTSSDKTENELG